MKSITRSILHILATASSAYACLGEHAHQMSERGTILARQSLPAVAPATLAINNVLVFDGNSFVGPQTVVMSGGKLMDNATQVNTSIDATGQYLIPGLIDAHAHPPNISALQNLTSYGVTTVLNMGCSNYTLCNSLKDVPGLTSLLTAGIPAIGPNSTHAELYQAQTPGGKFTNLFYGPSQAPAAVAFAFGNGSDFYKIIAEVNGPSEQSQMALVQSTKAFNKQSMTHASYLEAYMQAIASKTDGIQHLPQDGLLNQSMVAAILANGQFVTPTMTVFQYEYSEPAILHGLDTPKNASEQLDWVLENARMLYDAGVPLLAGTDSIGDMEPTYDFPFGLTLHQELQNLVTIGMTPAEAIRAATSTSAQHLRLSDRGSIAPGLRADLLLLNSNPLDDIKNTLDIAQVWVGGVHYNQVAETSPNSTSALPPSLS